MSPSRWSAAFWTFALLGLVGFSAFLGCGGGKAPAPAASSSGASGNESQAAAPGSTAIGSQPTEGTTGSGGVRVDASGRKFVGPVPFDVFFDDPIAVYSNKESVGGKPGDAVAEKVPDKPVDAPATPAADAGGVTDWAALLPMKIIEAEVKKIRNHLTDALSTLGKYNGNYKDIQYDGAVLSALGGIVIDHPENTTWKPNAKYIRDLGAKLEAKSQELGAKSYNESKAIFEQLEAVLSGNKPADLPESPDKAVLGEKVAVMGLMKRMERVRGHAKSNVNTEAIFKNSTDELTHEGAMLHACVQVLTLPGFPQSEEDAYKKHMTDLLAACTDFRKAVTMQDYKLFETSVNRIQKKCDECHVDYRFGDK